MSKKKKKITHGFRIKIITAGNHDTYLDPRFGYVKERNEMLAFAKKHNLIYLEHEKYEIPEWGLTLFVSPYAPLHFEGAFMLEDLSTVWDDIDDTVDILVTHTPPQGYLDTTRYKNQSVGCNHLRDRIDNVIHPRVHIFGHIHEAYGYVMNEAGQLFINASLCDRGYKPNHKPITFDISKLLQKSKKIKN
jgi:Icc-related predicted phosphoesterase